MSEQRREVSKKIVIVGDPDCGKSCLLSVFLKGIYPRFFVPPRMENLKWEVQINDLNASITFLDTMGNDGPNSNRPYAYLDADAVLLCYSIGSKKTLGAIHKPRGQKNFSEFFLKRF